MKQQRKKNRTEKSRKANLESVNYAISLRPGSKLLSQITGEPYEKATIQCEYGYVFTQEVKFIKVRQTPDTKHSYWCNCPVHRKEGNKIKRAMRQQALQKRIDKQELYKKLTKAANKINLKVVTTEWLGAKAIYTFQCIKCGKIINRTPDLMYARGKYQKSIQKVGYCSFECTQKPFDRLQFRTYYKQTNQYLVTK
ncbi:MAG: hypothetical protein HQK65_02260 [Desulfamplus sp.]|nr:hypothetical protein [Desulfamplus sp.]